MHPQHWRNIFDYSSGTITDWGAHLVDTAQIGAFVETHAKYPITRSESRNWEAG